MAEKQISTIPMESDACAWCLQILELVEVLERSGQRFQLFRIFGNPSWVNLVAKGSASKQHLIKLLLRKVQAPFLQILAQVGTIVRPRQELQFFEFLGLPGRVEMVTKDLTHPNIFYKPLIREVQAWILRSFSVVKALERLGQNYQNSGFFVIPGGVVQVAKDLAPERISNKPCIREVQTWILRVLAVDEAELGPGQNFPIFGISDVPGGGQGEAR